MIARPAPEWNGCPSGRLSAFHFGNLPADTLEMSAGTSAGVESCSFALDGLTTPRTRSSRGAIAKSNHGPPDATDWSKDAEAVRLPPWSRTSAAGYRPCPKQGPSFYALTI